MVNLVCIHFCLSFCINHYICGVTGQWREMMLWFPICIKFPVEIPWKNMPHCLERTTTTTVHPLHTHAHTHTLKQETVSGSGISWAICKSAPCSRQIATPAPHHSVFYRPDALPAAQPTASKHRRQPLYQYSNICWYPKLRSGAFY